MAEYFKCCIYHIAREDPWRVAWVVAAAAVIISDRLSDGLYLTLVAVGAWDIT